MHTEALCGFVMKHNHAGGVLVLAFMLPFGVLVAFCFMVMFVFMVMSFGMFMPVFMFMVVMGVRAARKSESRRDKKDM